LPIARFLDFQNFLLDLDHFHFYFSHTATNTQHKNNTQRKSSELKAGTVVGHSTLKRIVASSARSGCATRFSDKALHRQAASAGLVDNRPHSLHALVYHLLFTTAESSSVFCWERDWPCEVESICCSVSKATPLATSRTRRTSRTINLKMCWW